MSIKQICDQYYEVILTFDATVNARTQNEAYEQALGRLHRELEKATPSVSASYYASAREVHECDIRNCPDEATYAINDAGFFCKKHYDALTIRESYHASTENSSTKATKVWGSTLS